jgi:hypothetical protein
MIIRQISPIAIPAEIPANVFLRNIQKYAWCDDHTNHIGTIFKVEVLNTVTIYKGSCKKDIRL